MERAVPGRRAHACREWRGVNPDRSARRSRLAGLTLPGDVEPARDPRNAIECRIHVAGRREGSTRAREQESSGSDASRRLATQRRILRACSRPEPTGFAERQGRTSYGRPKAGRRVCRASRAGRRVPCFASSPPSRLRVNHGGWCGGEGGSRRSRRRQQARPATPRPRLPPRSPRAPSGTLPSVSGVPRRGARPAPSGTRARSRPPAPCSDC